MAKVRQRGVTGPRANTKPTRSTANGRRHVQAPAGWGRFIPVLAALTVVVIAGLVVWQALPAFDGDDRRTQPGPIATLKAPDVHSLLIDPTNPDHVLFGAHSGLQESRDGGFTWQAGTLQNADAMSMAASPADPSTMFVAGHDVFLASRDGGETWQPVAHDLPGTDLHAFAQDPVDPARLYALVVGAGIMTSADSGATWNPLPAQPPGGGGHGALATAGQSLYAVTQAGLVLSGDRGTTWEPLSTQPDGGAMSLAIPVASPEMLYVGTLSGLAKSTDGGASWDALGPDGVPVLALAVAPADPNRVLFVSDNGDIYRSDNGGASWLAPR